MPFFRLFTDIGVCELHTCQKVRRLYSVTRKGINLHLCGTCIYLTDPGRLKNTKQRKVRVKHTKYVKAGKLKVR